MLFHTGPVLLANQVTSLGEGVGAVGSDYGLNFTSGCFRVFQGRKTGRGKDLEPQPGLLGQGSQSLHSQKVPCGL